MFTILQLSDLHRAETEPFTNDEIISSLIADVERFSTERPVIARPDAIVVSGDLVQGLPLRSPAYPLGLKKQYDVALELMKRLTNTFLDGDRSKLVMIPGNHDVDFNQAFASMEQCDVDLHDVKGLLFRNEADNPHRWNWNDATLHKIINPTAYEDRFRYYCDMVHAFYDGISLAYPIDPHDYFNLYELDNGNIVVAAFNSCYGNDCFNYAGNIPQSVIAKCHIAIQQTGKRYKLKLAVWHHDIAGPPKRTDYMDVDCVRLLIDKGFRLGLHGHQHKAHASPEWIYTARRTSMVIVSSGSLCAASMDIPRGVSREYNVIEIAPTYDAARIHVREAKISDIFSAGRFIGGDNQSHSDVEWEPDPLILLGPSGTSPRIDSPLSLVSRLEELIAAGHASEAVDELDRNVHILGHHGRLLLTKALETTRDWPRLERHLGTPTSAPEAVSLITALLKQKKWPEARGFLDSEVAVDLLDLGTISDLRQWLAAEEVIGS